MKSWRSKAFYSNKCQMMPIFSHERRTSQTSAPGSTIFRKLIPAQQSAKASAPAKGSRNFETKSLVQDVLRSPGQPLEPATRTLMEARFRHDFSQVRIHADDRAEESADALHARAFTSGHNIVFGKGRYQPASGVGQRLLAHELAHVVQQEAGVHLPGDISQVGDPYERQADALSHEVISGSRATPPLDGIPLPSKTRSGGNSSRSFGGPIQRDQNFESQGPGVQDTAGASGKITRSEQVLYEYGITCYGTSVMYMLQSYGLVPPDMTREEFEYAFTPLNPKSSDHKAAKTDPITVAGQSQPDAQPIDLITKALEGTDRPSKRSTSLGKVTTTEATMRGADKGSLTVAQIMEHMPAILKAFNDQSKVKGYEFMKGHVPASGKAFAPGSKDKWIESSKEVMNGSIPADYFADGNTVMAGVSLSFPPDSHLGHWVVIVKEPEKKEIAGRNYLLYPADDPLIGPAFVMTPAIGKVDDDKLTAAGISSFGDYKSHPIRTLLSGYAFRRNVSLKP